MLGLRMVAAGRMAQVLRREAAAVVLQKHVRRRTARTRYLTTLQGIVTIQSGKSHILNSKGDSDSTRLTDSRLALSLISRVLCQG